MYFEKYTISQTNSNFLASVVLGTIFYRTTTASPAEVAPSTTQAAPATYTETKSPVAATEEITKANTPVVPAIAKTGDVTLWTSRQTGPSAKTDGADTITTNSNYQNQG